MDFRGPRPTVMKILDTNILVRYFTGEPEDQAQRATTFLSSAAPRDLLLVDLVAAELVFVLQSVYRQPRAAVTRLLLAVLALPAVRCDSAPLLHRTISIMRAVGTSPMPTSVQWPK